MSGNSILRPGGLAALRSFRAGKPTHKPEPDEITINMDPGRAFGTGGHASTRLCLLLLDKLGHYPQAEPARARLQTPFGESGQAEILDVGCGCGVLALAALKLWPLARALAIDIDPEAVEVTRENTERNALTDRLSATTKGFSASKVSSLGWQLDRPDAAHAV